MDLGLRGRCVAVTGGSRGIGLAIALRLAAEGADVAIAARTAADLALAHQRIEAAGGRCLAFACDLAEPGEPSAFIDAAHAAFGRLDAVICAAGGSEGPAFADETREIQARSFALNLFHAVETAQRAATLMPRGGSALFIGSISGHKPVAARWHYGAAKAALAHAASSLALELAPRGIRVNVLAPGSTLIEGGGWERRSREDPERFRTFIDQELPAGRLTSPEEVADMAVFLVSERAGGVNGAVVPVDGAQGRPSW